MACASATYQAYTTTGRSARSKFQDVLVPCVSGATRPHDLEFYLPSICWRCLLTIGTCAVKSFPTEQEALEYVAGKDTKKEGPPKYYAVARGPITGIYLDWKIVEEAITGAKGPKYKKFETIPEAVAYIEQWADDETIDAVRAQWDPRYEVEQEESELEPESEVDLDVSDSDDDETKSIIIYTDGSCLGNGNANGNTAGKEPAAAGVGVYFGDHDKRYGLPQNIPYLCSLLIKEAQYMPACDVRPY